MKTAPVYPERIVQRFRKPYRQIGRVIRTLFTTLLAASLLAGLIPPPAIEGLVSHVATHTTELTGFQNLSALGNELADALPQPSVAEAAPFEAPALSPAYGSPSAPSQTDAAGPVAAPALGPAYGPPPDPMAEPGAERFFALSFQSTTDIDLITNIDSSHDALYPGDANSYTVTVENRGPAAATSADWRVEIASADTISNTACAASGGASCPAFTVSDVSGLQVITASIGAMPTDSMLTLTFDSAAKDAAGTYSADSTVTANGQTDSYPETNDADINISILPRFLSWGATKSILRYEDAGGTTIATPGSGDYVIYEVVIENNGIDDVEGIRFYEEMGVDQGTGTAATLVRGTSVSGYERDFYAGGTTIEEITCTAANGAICPADQTFTTQTLDPGLIVIPFMPGRTRGALTNPASYPASTVTFEVKSLIGEVACSSAANTHRTILNRVRLWESTTLGERETSGLAAPYGPGDSTDNTVEVTFDVDAPTCNQYDIVTQVTESATQAASGIGEAGAYEYTVVVSNNGPDTVTDLPLVFGTHFFDTDDAFFSFQNRTSLHPDYWANLWTLNSPTCVPDAAGGCPTAYNVTSPQVLRTVYSDGSLIADEDQQTGGFDLPDATATIPSLPSGGSVTFTFTGTSGELVDKCGIPQYVNAYAHALPLDQMSETNIDIPSATFELYYLVSSRGWPHTGWGHGSYYGNNGFSLRTQWNTGEAGPPCGDTYDLSITMTGPFPDTTSTTPIPGSVPADTVVYYRVRVNNLDDGGLAGGIDFLDDRTRATGGFMAGFDFFLEPFAYDEAIPDWLDLKAETGMGTALPDHNHPLDTTPGLFIDQPAGYDPGYYAELDETRLPWAAWEDVGFECLSTLGGAECPDADDVTYYYSLFDTVNAQGNTGRRHTWGIATDWSWSWPPPIDDFEGDSLHMPEGSSIDFLIPYHTPPLTKPCVPGGDTFVYAGGIYFEATVYGHIPEGYSVTERDDSNNQSGLTFQMEVPACVTTLEIDKRTVVPAAVDVVPADGIVRYEVDLTYPATAASALDVARFTDIPALDCGGIYNPTNCADYEVINVVSCSVTSGTATCPPSIPIGQQLNQDGSLTAIDEGTIDTRWGTPNATSVAGGAAFEPNSSITIILEAQLTNGGENLAGVENTAAFASDPDSSQPQRCPAGRDGRLHPGHHQPWASRWAGGLRHRQRACQPAGSQPRRLHQHQLCAADDRTPIGGRPQRGRLCQHRHQ